MLIAQITDFHVNATGKWIKGVHDPVANLERCVQQLHGLPRTPDLVLATGDLVDAGEEAEYGLVKEILNELRVPLFLIPGNHDARGPLRAVFDEHRYLPPLGEMPHYVIEDWPLRLIGLDTLRPGDNGGELGPAGRDWLSRCLAQAPERPTLVFMHHPPFRTGIPEFDDMGCADGAELIELLGRAPQVERVLCGHVHRPIQARVGGVACSVAPSTCLSYSLSLRPGEKLYPTGEPPGFQLHFWDGATSLVTHTLAIGDFFEPPPGS